MFESIMNFFKKLGKSENKETKSKETAKERLHLVLMQDRANVSADFLEMMKQEIIEVIKKYIEVDEKEIDVRLTNEVKADGTTGAPSLYANIPIVNIKNEKKQEMENEQEETSKEQKKEEKAEDKKQEDKKIFEEEIEIKEEQKNEKENEKVKQEDNKEEIVQENNNIENKEDNKSGE